VKKITACILLALLSFALSLPAVARTKGNASPRAAQRNARKVLKQQKKQQKKDRKTQNKATKEWKKHHRTSF
jgi:inosine-uridine nucleoside N-ribohydrolase